MLRPLNALFDARPHDDILIGLGGTGADDAAVRRLPDGRVTVVTTDFFPPVVDDAADFGAIAAANAMSDVWAMGAEPAVALCIALFPSDMPIPIAQAILQGAGEQVRDAGAVIAGGHTMDNRDPIFGLAVVGFGREDQLMRKGGLEPGQRLLLTKPLGTGVLTTAAKRGLISAAELAPAVSSMRALNGPASRVAVNAGVRGATDITGFGLAGHAIEMARASDVTLRISAAALPWLPEAERLAREGIFPGGARRNERHFGGEVAASAPEHLRVLCFDPQTSGGLLLGVNADQVHAVLAGLRAAGVDAHDIGEVCQPDASARIVLT